MATESVRFSAIDRDGLLTSIRRMQHRMTTWLAVLIAAFGLLINQADALSAEIGFHQFTQKVDMVSEPVTVRFMSNVNPQLIRTLRHRVEIGESVPPAIRIGQLHREAIEIAAQWIAVENKAERDIEAERVSFPEKTPKYSKDDSDFDDEARFRYHYRHTAKFAAHLTEFLLHVSGTAAEFLYKHYLAGVPETEEEETPVERILKVETKTSNDLNNREVLRCHRLLVLDPEKWKGARGGYYHYTCSIWAFDIDVTAPKRGDVD